MKSDIAYTTKLNSELEIRSGSDDGEYAILLHGYGQSGVDIIQSLKDYLPDRWTLLAPNAPFPFYNSRLKKLLYSWYFFDPEIQEFVVSRQAAKDMLKQLIQTQVPKNKKWYVLGYSQGGYMAPFVADLAIDTHGCPEQVVLLNGRLRHEELATSHLKFPIVCIHGEKDETVEYANAKLSAEKMQASNWKIDFQTIKDSSHELDGKILEYLKLQFQIQEK